MSDEEVPGKGVPDKRAPGKKPSGGKASGKKGSGSKGIETMYRNAYRAELDLIALAATKANIMISLNGFIISALMISGGFIYASSPLFLLPATVFLFTSALSVYFALLAASPERIGTFGKVATWFGAVRRREAAIRDLPLYVRCGSRVRRRQVERPDLRGPRQADQGELPAEDAGASRQPGRTSTTR